MCICACVCACMRVYANGSLCVCGFQRSVSVDLNIVVPAGCSVIHFECILLAAAFADDKVPLLLALEVDAVPRK